MRRNAVLKRERKIYGKIKIDAKLEYDIASDIRGLRESIELY